MISNKDMQISKGLAPIYDVFVPTTTGVLGKIGLFTGAMPSLNSLPPNINQNGQLGIAQMLTDLGVLQAQFLGNINFTNAATRKPVVTHDVVARKIGVSFSNITTDLLGIAVGTPTFFIALGTSTASTDASSWAAFISGTYAYSVIIGTVGDEDSNAEMKLVGGKIVAGQGYRFTDLAISY